MKTEKGEKFMNHINKKGTVPTRKMSNKNRFIFSVVSTAVLTLFVGWAPLVSLLFSENPKTNDILALFFIFPALCTIALFRATVKGFTGFFVSLGFMLILPIINFNGLYMGENGRPAEFAFFESAFYSGRLALLLGSIGFTIVLAFAVFRTLRTNVKVQ